MPTTTVRNGIDVDQLMQTIDAIKSDSSLGEFQFRAASSWQGGTHNSGRIEGFVHGGAEDTSRTHPFVLEGDEPPVLLGENHGPNAVELLLQALSFCYAVGYAANAAARGIELTQLDVEVEGDLDVRAFLGLDVGRPGFTTIRVRARVNSPDTAAEDLESLGRYVADTSPVRDCLTNPVPVETTVEVSS